MGQWCGRFAGSSGGAIDSVTETAASVTGYSNVGGLVGNITGSGAHLSNSTTSANVFGLSVGATTTPGIGAATGTGGAVGLNQGAISNVTVTGNTSGDTNVGGIVGNNQAGNSNGGMINGGSNTGSVTGTGNNVGGIAGYNSGTIQAATNSAAVYGNNNVGGMVGNNGPNPGNGNYIGTVIEGFDTGIVSGSGAHVSNLVGTNTGFINTSGLRFEDVAAEAAAAAAARAAAAFEAQQQANFESNGQQTGGQASFSGQGSNSTGQGLSNQIGSFTPSNTGTVNGTMDNHIVFSDSAGYSATIKSINADGMQFNLEGGSQGGGGAAGGGSGPNK